MPRVAFRSFFMALLIAVSVSCSPSNNAKVDSFKSEVTRLSAELALANLEAAAAKAEAVAAKATAEKRPKLSRDAKVEDAIRSAGGYEEVIMVRWQHGILEGWVEFDEKAGPMRISLATTEAFKLLVKDSKKIDSKDFSGILFLGLRKQPGASGDEFDCELGLYWHLENVTPGQELKSTGGGFSSKSKVKLANDPSLPKGDIRRIQGTGVELDRFVDQKTVPWLRLRLVDAPK